MQLNGARILLECLKEQGVDTVFGYPGGTILNVYDEMYKYCPIAQWKNWDTTTRTWAETSRMS